MKVVNYDVTETWTMDCPNCEETQEAPFNSDAPMQPLEVMCANCHTRFLLTYERE